MSETNLIPSPFDATSTARDVLNGISLDGRTAVVTGGATGIGQEIATALAESGAHVVIADVAREPMEATRAAIAAAGGSASAFFLDLGLLRSAAETGAAIARQHARIDILINNAGIMACPLGRTADGHERQFGVNYLGHFALTTALRPALQRAGNARIVSVASIGHRRSDIVWDDIDYERRVYDRWEAYGQSKTACALLALAVTERWKNDGITCNAINPGGSMTGLQRFLTDEELRQQGWIDADGKVNARWRSPAQCAATSVWVATSPLLDGIGGRYFENCQEAGEWHPELPMQGLKQYARSPVNAHRLWEISERMAKA